MRRDIKNIFIVDDDEMLSEMLMDHLSQFDAYGIQMFTTGEECLENLHNKPEIVILDYNLNSIHEDAANGYQILKAIKNLDKDILVIMYSSQKPNAAVVSSIGTDAIQYVMKDQDAFSKIEHIIRSL